MSGTQPQFLQAMPLSDDHGIVKGFGDAGLTNRKEYSSSVEGIQWMSGLRQAG
jgi:hypothetical protein